MRRFLTPGIALLIAVGLLALLAFGVSNQGENKSIDSALARGIQPPVPGANIALPVLGASSTRTLADYRGKVVVLNFFASWCDPCRAEAPILEHEQSVLARHDGTILAVTYLDNSSDSQTFVRQEHITYPVLRDVSGNFVRGFGTNGVPETFVIDRQGRIVAVQRAQLVGNWLAQAVARVLRPPA